MSLHQNYLEGLLEYAARGHPYRSDWQFESKQGWESKFPNRFPGDADTADLGPHFETQGSTSMLRASCLEPTANFHS